MKHESVCSVHGAHGVFTASPGASVYTNTPTIRTPDSPCHFVHSELHDKSRLTSSSRAPSGRVKVCSLCPFFLPSRLRAYRGNSTRCQRSVRRKGGGLPHHTPQHTLSPRSLDGRGLPAHTSGHWPKRRQLPSRCSHHWPRACHLAKGGRTPSELSLGTPQHDPLINTPLATAPPHRTKCMTKDTLIQLPLAQRTVIGPRTCHLAKRGTHESEPQPKSAC